MHNTALYCVLRCLLKNKNFFILLTILVMFILLPGGVSAETYNLEPVEDTYVRQNFPKNNYGNANELVSDGSPLARIFMKFDTSGVTGEVTSVILQLTPTLNRNVQKNFHSTKTNWSERNTNWNNQPALGILIANLNTSVISGQLVSIDITNGFIQNSGKLFSIAIDDTLSGDILRIYSRESSLGKPRLIISTKVKDGDVVIPGDANNDGVVDEVDYEIWKQNNGAITSLGHSVGDFNQNGVVDGVDFTIWWSNFGNTKGPEPSPTNVPYETPTPTTAPFTPPPSTGGIWISPEEIKGLPTSGSAYQNVVNHANSTISPSVATDNVYNKRTYAAALLAVRNNDTAMKNKVIKALQDVQGTEETGFTGQSRILRICRNLPAYIIAADVIGYKDPTFVKWVEHVRNKIWPDYTNNVILHHAKRPNNHGTHCGAARLAADLYLGDTNDFKDAVIVWKGYLGDRSSYSNNMYLNSLNPGFRYGDLAWQADQKNPVGINPKGSKITIDGVLRNVDGVIPDDQRRQLEHGYPIVSWPPNKEPYVWEALQGVVVASEIMWRNGYPDVYSWSDQAILRAVNWLHDPDGSGPLEYPWFPAEGDDRWQPWIINKRYGTSFPTGSSGSGGKNMGFTDWTHAK
jgi:hypothetical protein